MTLSASAASSRLNDLSKYTYGTTRLGDSNIPFEDRVAIAREAIEAGVGIHTSHTYGDALKVLRAAFDLDRANISSAIFKIGWSTIEEMRDVIKQNIEPLGIDHMAIGQLCLGGQLADEFRTGGKCYDDFRRLKDEGLVNRFVLEVWPWTSHVPLAALQAGYPDGVVDGYIFYLNPLQRFVSDELWDLLLERNEPIVAMRTVAGGSVLRLMGPEGHGPEYLRKRAPQIAPLFERSGCKSWTEFCVRFAYGFPQVRTTVGSTAKHENLVDFLDAVKSITPLPADIQSEVIALQRQWYHDHDRHAEPWSM